MSTSGIDFRSPFVFIINDSCHTSTVLKYVLFADDTTHTVTLSYCNITSKELEGPDGLNFTNKFSIKTIYFLLKKMKLAVISHITYQSVGAINR